MRLSKFLQAKDSMLLNENIHEESSHIRSTLIELEKPPVITIRESLPHFEGMQNTFLLFVFRSNFLKNLDNFHVNTDENLIKQLVSEKLNSVLILDVLFVHIVKLGLTLIKLVQICHFESNSCVSFVDLHC